MSDDTSPLKKVEGWLESLLFASRWILAPIYLGLALSLIVLLIKFVAELAHIVTHAFSASESDVILGVLALVDLALTGSLLVIVIFSGYENFVSRIDHGNHKDWPEWMGKIDFSALKLKLLSSIVAISAVQLLKQFMSLKVVTPENERVLFWLVVIHVVFVVSSVFLALSDRIAGHGDDHGGHGGGGNYGPSHGTDGHGGNDGRTMVAGAAPAASATHARTAERVPQATVRKGRVEVRKDRSEPQRPRTMPVTDEDLPLPGERPPAIKRRLN